MERGTYLGVTLGLRRTVTPSSRDKHKGRGSTKRMEENNKGKSSSISSIRHVRPFSLLNRRGIETDIFKVRGIGKLSWYALPILSRHRGTLMSDWDQLLWPKRRIGRMYQ